MHPYLLSDKTWCELEEMRTKRVIIPMGSIEQHGPHLPLDTDSLIAERISQEIAETINAIFTPVISFGFSKEHIDFKGTLSLSPNSLEGIVIDISKSLIRYGFNNQHIINSHGGNTNILKKILKKMEGNGAEIKLHSVLGKIGKFDHAGEVETSLMLYLYPEKVRIKKIKDFEYRIPKVESWRTIDYSKSGVIGDAINASIEKGGKYFKKIVDEILKEIRYGKTN